METRVARDIMRSPVITIDSETTLREAAQILHDSGISGAPVIDSERRVVGILSESDLLSEAKKRAALPRIGAFGLFMAPAHIESLQRIYHDGETLLVREIMATRIRTLPDDAPLSEVGDLLTRKKINRIPIVDSDERLIGIITREDLLTAIFHLEDASADAGETDAKE